MSEGRGGGGVTSAAKERPVGEVEVILAVYFVLKWRRRWKWNGFIGATGLASSTSALKKLLFCSKGKMIFVWVNYLFFL